MHCAAGHEVPPPYTACTACQAGSTDHDQSASTLCQICPAGRYDHDNASNSACIACTGMGNEVTGAPFCSSCGRGATLVNVGIGIRTYVLSHARHVFDAWVHVLHAHAPHAQGGLRADHALLEGMITIAPQAQHVRDVLRGVMLVPSEGLCAAGVPPVCTIMMLVAALPAPIVWAVGLW